MKHTTIYTGGKKVEGLRFQGELMKCQNCGAEQFSNPAKESGWTGIELNGNKFFYFCPKCWPSPHLGEYNYAAKVAELIRRAIG